ncbi:hypothetical protein FB45DRAFT_914822 [Roridomyces roridus]|uniref:Uncharacterized protein n=1 Tax=Roridomyces roridus TaxID=1738132 RepID=A0AAD7BSW4_9AGAR|nr:hypothetical protein FB45DRAFT_914822 [Roridomyces roridus]
MSTNYTVDAEEFEFVAEQFLSLMVETCASFVLYGFYVHYFLSTISNLSRRVLNGRLPLLIAIWLMLLFATTHTVLGFTRDILYFRFLQAVVRASPGVDQTFEKSLAQGQNILFAVNNLLTDTFLLYRCYLVWNRRIWVTILPGMLMIAAFVPAVLQSLDLAWQFSLAEDVATFGLATLTNMILTGLIAGRIWWMSREVSNYTETYSSVFQRRYGIAMRIILESGALYCLFSLTLTITSPFMSVAAGYVRSITFALGWQILNIIPTVALVRGVQQPDDCESESECLDIEASPSSASHGMRPRGAAVVDHKMVFAPASRPRLGAQPSDVSSQVIYIGRKSEESA